MLSTLGLGDYVTQACNGICKFCTATFITTFLPFQEMIFFLLFNWMSVDFWVCSIVQKRKQLLNKTLSHLSWFDWWNLIGFYRCWNSAEPACTEQETRHPFIFQFHSLPLPPYQFTFNPKPPKYQTWHLPIKCPCQNKSCFFLTKTKLWPAQNEWKSQIWTLVT